MRAPRHYLLLLVVYLHSSSKEKRETHISLTNSLFFSSSVLSLFIILSLFCSSLSSCCLSFLHFFVKKMQIHFPLLSKTCKKNSPPKLIEGQTKKEKREEELLQRIDFFRDDGRRRDYSLETLSSKKIIIQTQGVFTHTHACTHTHTFVSLSLDL